MLLFFVTIGTAAGSPQALVQTRSMAGFIAVQLGVHLAICLGAGRLLKLPSQVGPRICNLLSAGISITRTLPRRERGMQALLPCKMCTAARV